MRDSKGSGAVTTADQYVYADDYMASSHEVYTSGAGVDFLKVRFGIFFSRDFVALAHLQSTCGKSRAGIITQPWNKLRQQAIMYSFRFIDKVPFC